MKVLVIYSNPPDQEYLRLDREDKTIALLSRQFKETVSVERLHASEIEDIHKVIIDGEFEVIQFSGHGSTQGIYLEKSNYKGDSSELVSAERVVSIINLANKNPLIVLFLSCYSDSFIETLSNAAPFVVTSKDRVEDEECIVFVQGFYERLFRGASIKSAFDQSVHLLVAKGYPSDSFKLSRRTIIKKGDSLFVESKPNHERDSILVNLDSIQDQMGKFEMSEEELCHLIARKLTIHYWIFDRARESAIIPIGRLLFGEFWWENAKDVVFCRRLMKLRTDVPKEHWQIWSKVLTAYNDLTSCEYRSAKNPASPGARGMLERAVSLFKYHTQKNFSPLRDVLEKMGFENVIPNLEFGITYCEMASAHLDMGRYQQVVEALETSLTNYHEVVTLLQPPEEKK